MTHIFIKSFNRPYYLDRCIASIYQNVSGNFEIIVLDDGTPEKYINKIKLKYPSISVKISKQAIKKRIAIKENLETGKKINGFEIPTDLWKSEVQIAKDYVLVTEDDVWFTTPIDLDDIIKCIYKENIPLVKLGWLGMNYNADKCYTNILSENIVNATPKKLFTSNKLIMNLFMYNKYKFFTILYKLGYVDNNTKEEYWHLNSILMGLYKKEYWLTIWKDAIGQVDEKQQLRNAAAWYHKNKNAIFARTKQEVLKTTFKSSATSSYHEYGNPFDVNRFNFILNEFWLNDDFNSLENYPNDFSDGYIQQKLEKANHPDAQYTEWYIWAEKFRQQYRNIGCIVE